MLKTKPFIIFDTQALAFSVPREYNGVGGRNMNKTDMSRLTVTSIEMVVSLDPDTDSGFTLIEGTKVKQFGPRRYHGLVFKTDGTNRYIVEDKYVLDAEPGSVLYLPEGRPYIVLSGRPGGCFCVNFHVTESALMEPFLFFARNPAKWQENFSEMVRSWTYRKPGYRAKCLSLLYEMLACIEEDRQARYLPGNQIAAIRQIMRKTEEGGLCKAAVSVPQLAEACGMSETYFRRLFHEMYGVSPKQYILEARFRRAKALLESSDATIAYIADASGFENIYHFSRAFRTHEGISPSEYRSQHR